MGLYADTVAFPDAVTFGSQHADRVAGWRAHARARQRAAGGPSPGRRTCGRRRMGPRSRRRRHGAPQFGRMICWRAYFAMNGAGAADVARGPCRGPRRPLGSRRTRPNRRSPTATPAPSPCPTSTPTKRARSPIWSTGSTISGARQAQLVHARLAAERADQDGPAAVRHHLGGLSRIGLAPADRRSLRLSLAADQRHAAPALAPGRRTFAAHAGQRDRRAFHRRRARPDPRHRDADAGRRRRLLSDRPHRGCISTAVRCATGRA